MIPREHSPDRRLSEDALAGIGAALGDLYGTFYQERPVDARASLTGNMLAFVFEGGLSRGDEWLLQADKGERLTEFRRQFFDVIDEELIDVVVALTGRAVGYSFYGFDPRTRTTHAIFVLDLNRPGDPGQRQAVLNWSEQVRRNARRLRAEHRELRDRHLAVREASRRQLEAHEGWSRSAGPDGGSRSSDGG